MGRKTARTGKGGLSGTELSEHKTQRPVQFEITQATRDAVQAWIKQAGQRPEDFLFPSRLHEQWELGDQVGNRRAKA